MNENFTERLVTYVSPALYKWVMREAKKHGVKESSYLRAIIVKAKAESNEKE